MIYIEGGFQVLKYFFANLFKENSEDSSSVPEAVDKIATCIKNTIHLQ